MTELERRGEWHGSSEVQEESLPGASSEAASEPAASETNEAWVVLKFKDPHLIADAERHARDPSVRSLVDEVSGFLEDLSPVASELFNVAGGLAEEWSGLVRASGSPLIGDLALIHAVAATVPPFWLVGTELVDAEEINRLMHAQALACMGILASSAFAAESRDDFYELLDESVTATLRSSES